MNLNNIALKLQYYLDSVPMAKSERNDAEQSLMVLLKKAQTADELQAKVNELQAKADEGQKVADKINEQIKKP